MGESTASWFGRMRCCRKCLRRIYDADFGQVVPVNICSRRESLPILTSTNFMRNADLTVDIGPEELKNQIVEILQDSKAVDVVELDVGKLCSFADYMIVASGTSNRHVNALVEHTVDGMKANAQKPIGVEGRETNEWVLVDYGDVIVHLMQRDARAFYDLERLWSDLPESDEATDQ